MPAPLECGPGPPRPTFCFHQNAKGLQTKRKKKRIPVQHAELLTRLICGRRSHRTRRTPLYPTVKSYTLPVAQKVARAKLTDRGARWHDASLFCPLPSCLCASYVYCACSVGVSRENEPGDSGTFSLPEEKAKYWEIPKYIEHWSAIEERLSRKKKTPGGVRNPTFWELGGGGRGSPLLPLLLLRPLLFLLMPVVLDAVALRALLAVSFGLKLLWSQRR